MRKLNATLLNGTNKEEAILKIKDDSFAITTNEQIIKIPYSNIKSYNFDEQNGVLSIVKFGGNPIELNIIKDKQLLELLSNLVVQNKNATSSVDISSKQNKQEMKTEEMKTEEMKKEYVKTEKQKVELNQDKTERNKTFGGVIVLIVVVIIAIFIFGSNNDDIIKYDTKYTYKSRSYTFFDDNTCEVSDTNGTCTYEIIDNDIIVTLIENVKYVGSVEDINSFHIVDSNTLKHYKRVINGVTFDDTEGSIWSVK